MLEVLNSLWPRTSLGWRTATEAWDQRPQLNVDRHALREEVQIRAARVARTPEHRDHADGLAERLAIEQTLEQMGYLRQEIGGWC